MAIVVDVLADGDDRPIRFFAQNMNYRPGWWVVYEDHGKLCSGVVDYVDGRAHTHAESLPYLSVRAQYYSVPIIQHTKLGVLGWFPKEKDIQECWVGWAYNSRTYFQSDDGAASILAAIEQEHVRAFMQRVERELA